MRPTYCPRCKQPLGPAGGGGATSLRCPACSTAIVPEDAALTDAPPSPTAGGWGGEPKRLPVEPWVRVIQPLGLGWRTVYFGLGLIKWGTVAALAALAFNVLMVLAAPSHRPAVARASLPTDDHIGLLAVAIPSALSVVLSLLGRLCCCSVPSGTGARLPAVLAFFGTLLSQLLAGVIVLNIVLLALQAASPLWLIPVVLASGSAALLAEVLFLVFLYRVGRSLQEPAVRRRVLRLVIGTVIVVVGVVFAVFFRVLSAATFPPAPASAGSLPPGRPPGASALAGRGLLAWLAVVFGAALVLLQYLDLIHITRHALARRVARDAATRSAGA
jgi:hypothetical protein